MTNQTFPRRLLDDAIDHAVRELVHTDARPGFRRRVLDRLHQPKTRSAWWPTVAIPATAIAALLLAIVVLREPSPAPQTVAGSEPTPAAAPADPLRTAVASPEAPPAKAPRRSALPEFRFGPRSDRVAATSVTSAPMVESVASIPEDSAVTAPPPIAIAPLAAPSAIAIRPITFSRIDAAASSGSK